MERFRKNLPTVERIKSFSPLETVGKGPNGVRVTSDCWKFHSAASPINQLLIGNSDSSRKKVRVHQAPYKRWVHYLRTIVITMYVYSNRTEKSNKPSFPKMSKEPASQVDAFHVGTHCQLKSCNVFSPLTMTFSDLDSV